MRSTRKIQETLQIGYKFQIKYTKGTRKIHETIRVNYDFLLSTRN